MVAGHAAPRLIDTTTTTSGDHSSWPGHALSLYLNDSYRHSSHCQCYESPKNEQNDDRTSAWVVIQQQGVPHPFDSLPWSLPERSRFLFLFSFHSLYLLDVDYSPCTASPSKCWQDEDDPHDAFELEFLLRAKWIERDRTSGRL